MLRQPRQSVVREPAAAPAGGLASEAAYAYEEPVNPGAAPVVAGVGLAMLLVGAWGGIVPYVGPLFGYGATGTPSFVWNMEHSLLWLLPGAVSLVLGAILMVRAQAVAAGGSRAFTMFAGLVVACCGAWLVIAPVAWPVLQGTRTFVAASAWRNFLNEIGYSVGPGSLLILLGGMAIGAGMLAQRAVMPLSLRSSQPLAVDRAA